MSDSYNSDDERYADDTFEQESDTDIPEMAEIESEISEDDDDRLPSVKMNTGPIKRPTNFPMVRSAKSHTDAVPFDSSSDEEDDVIVGQTLAEINTPSMHFLAPQMSNSSDSLKKKSNAIQVSDSSVSETEDSDEEREFQRIRDMEERYIQQNSANASNTPNTTYDMEHTPNVSDNSNEEESELETENEMIETLQGIKQRTSLEEEEDIAIEKIHRKRSTHSLKNIKSMTQITEDCTQAVSEKSSLQPSRVLPQIQANFMEIIQSSLNNLITGKNTSQPESSDSKTSTSAFDSNHILNPENIATAFLTAMSSTNISVCQKNDVQTNVADTGNVEDEETKTSEDVTNSDTRTEDSSQTTQDESETATEDQEEEITPRPQVDGETSYYRAQFEYEITSKPPSCFNSEDYVFHANLIRPPMTTDKLRPKPQPRKSMSFSNERMREIERHNQILLRKILTQKPTYSRGTPSKTHITRLKPSTSNGRLTTSAMNRKKQQRQIDLDNQVLKRKIEAISLRRRPLVTS